MSNTGTVFYIHTRILVSGKHLSSLQHKNEAVYLNTLYVRKLCMLIYIGYDTTNNTVIREENTYTMSCTEIQTVFEDYGYLLHYLKGHDYKKNKL